MRWTIFPMMDPGNEIDMKHVLVKAVAEEIWRCCGGNDALNWMEAEWHVEELLRKARPVRMIPATATSDEAAPDLAVEVCHLRRPPLLPAAAPGRP